MVSNMEKPCILIAGGAGFIGAHTAKALAESGEFVPVVLDNFRTGFREFVKWGPLVEGDAGSVSLVRDICNTYRPVAAINFSGAIEVGGSVIDPGLFYDINLAKGLSLFRTLADYGIPVIFSSSAAIYKAQSRPISETDPIFPESPYGRTKYMVEQVLADFDHAYGLPHVNLRYFNASGGDFIGEIGESHRPETHLIPCLLDFVWKRRTQFGVFGTDYPTPDGSCVRDFIHVTDLADA
ncbi:UDP-glucose 4-epimerase, partial [bacterium]|nr:UDP-glucose 4-epimerase [bacterium]